MQWIVDITSARKGTEGPTLSSFLHTKCKPEYDNILVLHTEAQVIPELANFEITANKVEPATASTDTIMGAEVLRLLNEARNAGGSIGVASYRAKIRSTVEMVAVLDGGVEFIELAPFSPPRDAQAEDAAEWDDKLMNRTEAIQHFANALAGTRDLVRMTKIRGLLANEDRRFDKNTGIFSHQKRFVSIIVAVAELAGIVARVYTAGYENNPELVLTETGRALATKNTSPTRAHTESRTTRLTMAPQHPPQRRDETRSDVFISALRQGEFGPFQEVRLAAYGQMERLVGTSEPNVGTLLRDTVASLREREKELVRASKPYPWSKFRSFLTKLVNLRPVLLHDEQPLHYSWTQVDQRVTRLADDWQLELDGELICFLLRDGVSISLDDAADLAGALYNSRRDYYYDLVLAVVKRLTETQRVHESAENLGFLELA